MVTLQTPLYRLEIGGKDGFLRYCSDSFCRTLEGPVFEVDGAPLLPRFSNVTRAFEKKQNDQVTEYAFDAVYEAEPSLTLRLFVRLADASPILRFRYVLKGDASKCLTKTNGENLAYAALALAKEENLTEVRFSEFNAMLHSFCLNEVPVKASAFANWLDVMGPLLAATDGANSFLLAYEHGSQYPEAFVHFCFTPERGVVLRAKKGNYLTAAPIDADGFETIWFDFGAVKGGVDALAAVFRAFLLKYMAVNTESRKPYLFYNSWCYQERNKWWNQKTYLADMNEERMLCEIDAAHEMGLEVFVLDTGWYAKTGDWEVNRNRFPDGMKRIKERLDSYGMKLGLWIDPRAAAISSEAYRNHPECRCEWNGVIADPQPIWETEESYGMCLVSPYWETLADTLIRLVKETGATYLKWDAIDQYSCNSPHHNHGTAAHTAEECAESNSFQIGAYMKKIVSRICEACPDVIVDFDITEGRRNVGLSFLSVGKYFLINNGPYYENYNIPLAEDKWTNIFVHPGAPRTWICRSPLTFDKWIPSVLFLTHYLPDDPIHSQDINLASMILGQNGTWGDLPGVSKEGRARFNEILSKYKKVRDDITAEAAIKSGMTGSAMECYEKIASDTGKGVVCVFTETAGSLCYITEKRTVSSWWSSVPAVVTPLQDGTAKIEIAFDKPGAVMIFFGAE